MEGHPPPVQMVQLLSGFQVSQALYVAAKIGVELRNQYLLGYTPTNKAKDGKYRHVQVKLVQPRGLPPLKAYYRLGYYAPYH